MVTLDRLDELLAFLCREHGVDFTRYKRTTVVRRLAKRLAAVRAADYGAYLDHLKAHPEELTALLDVLLINVTSFFRDAEAWTALQADVLPALLAKKGHTHFRVWCAGCATGEEPYTIAIVLHELLSAREMERRVKIYATDLDDDALQRARRAIYSARDVAALPEAIVAKYFLRAGDHYEVQGGVRRSVVFGRHDLIKDPPLSRIDLLACRNTLMYFRSETQAKVLGHLRFALNDGGVLMLGRAEGVLADPDAFAPLNLKRRIFAARAGGSRLRATLYPLADRDPAILSAAYDAGANAQIVVDAKGALVLANGRARDLFGLSALDFGRPIQHMELACEPMNLRTPIERAYGGAGESLVRDVARQAFGFDPSYFDAQITPLRDGRRPIGAQVTFTDVTERPAVRREVRDLNQQVDTACSELRATGEELETTNEELEAALEELETANEELETANEGLSSANGDLFATNEALRESEDVSMRLWHTVVDALGAAVVVVDEDRRIQYRSPGVDEVWGTEADDLNGKSLRDLDARISSDLDGAVRAHGEDGPAEVVVQTIGRRGDHLQCNVRIVRVAEGERALSILVVRVIGAVQRARADNDSQG